MATNATDHNAPHRTSRLANFLAWYRGVTIANDLGRAEDHLGYAIEDTLAPGKITPAEREALLRYLKKMRTQLDVYIESLEALAAQPSEGDHGEQ